MDAGGDTAVPVHTRARPQIGVVVGGRPATRKRTALPTPPARERPPALAATEFGMALYGDRHLGRGAIAVARLQAGDTVARLEATFEAATLTVQNRSATLTVIASLGEADPVIGNAILVCGPGRLVSVPIGAERVIRLATATGAPIAAGDVVIATATDARLSPAAGAIV